MNIAEKTRLIKVKCKELFDDCGIIKPQILKEEAQRFNKWLSMGYHDQMKYMERNKDKRLNPALLFEEVKSIIVVLLNYYPEKQLSKNSKYLISKYAYGTDYHFVIKKRLRQLLEYINTEITEVKGRAFTDSAPILERALAKQAGLGWIGKNSLLLTKKGSYFFIGELFVNIELEYEHRKSEITSLCGTCTRCIEACPTKAIIKPYVIDARKCISNLTIERKPPIPNQFRGKYKQWIFGCDICQDVCPWNSRQKPTKISEFEPKPDLLTMKAEDWENLTKQQFNYLFKNSPLKRRKYSGIMHNIMFLKNGKKFAN